MIRRAGAKTDVARHHLQAMHIGSEVTRWFRKEREPNVLQVTPERVLAALHRAGIKPVLMGIHGLNGYRDEARATQDVDILVIKKHVRKAVRILEETFPYLEVTESIKVARFIDTATQKPVIDVMKPSVRALQVVFRHTVPIGKTHRIPDLEMALASKFVGMKGPALRSDRKLLHAADFVDIAVTNRAALDLQKLGRLGDMVHPGGGKIILDLVADIDAGRTIQP